MQIAGSTAVVAGGGSGLGSAAAAELIACGANVAILDLPTSPGAEVAQDLGPNACFAPADVTSEEQVAGAIAQAADRFGDLRICVNCAGVATPGRLLGREGPLALESFTSVIAVNLIGTFNVMRYAAARMAALDPIEDECGIIINTASIAAFEGQIGQLAYAASKAGVIGLTLPAARELAPRRIRVVAVAPGSFDTPMVSRLRQSVREELGRATPNPNRLGRPAEYALLVRQIVENPMLNGDVIRLDGALRLSA